MGKERFGFAYELQTPAKFHNFCCRLAGLENLVPTWSGDQDWRIGWDQMVRRGWANVNAHGLANQIWC